MLSRMLDLTEIYSQTEAQNENGFTCQNERDVCKTNDDDYGHPKGSTSKAMSQDYEQRIVQSDLQYCKCDDARNRTNLEELSCQ